MVYKKENLIKLLELIDSISQHPENVWFKNELSLRFGSGANFEDFPTFLKFLKKNYRLKANEFYKNIKDQKLKNELVKDNVEMQWYQASHDVERFLLFTFYQVENLLNYYCIRTDAFSKIENDKNKYQYTFGFNVICYDSFFNRKSGEPNSIEKVNSVYAKIAYWLVQSNRGSWYKSFSFSMSNLIKVRNKNSHRSSSSEPDEKVEHTLELLKKQDFSSLSFYINIVKELIKTIDELDQKNIALDPVNKDFSKNGLKVKGKIDLSKLK